MKSVSNLLEKFRTHYVTMALPYTTVVLVVIFAPFEKQQPLLVLPWQKLSNLEFLLSSSLVLSGLFFVLRRQAITLKSALTFPAAALIAIMVLSSWNASYPDEALRSCGRFVVGFLLYILVLNVVKTYRQLIGIMISAITSGSVVALVAILEYADVSHASIWTETFRRAPIFIGGELRVSSTLQYPTIASMYLEIIFALGLGLFLFCVQERRWVTSFLSLLLQILILEGIILTLTRSGLIVVVSLLMWAGSVWLLRIGRNRGFWAVTVLSLASIALLLFGATLDSKVWLRMITTHPADWYQVEYTVPSQIEFTAGATHHVEVSLVNRGQIAWEGAGEAPVQLAYHWLESPSEEVVVFEGLRTKLPHRVLPGEAVSLVARVETPHRAGTYLLAWDLVRENRIWFSSLGLPSPHTVAVVRGEGHRELTPDRSKVPGVRFDMNRLTLWRAAAEMLLQNPALGIGPDNFRLLYGPQLGLTKWNSTIHSNNMFAEFFVSLGLIGGIVFLWFVWRILMIVRDLLLKSDRQDLPIAVALSGAIVALLLHGLTDYFLPFTPTYIMIWVCLGLAVRFLRLREAP